ncbi:hypothetical protein [Paenibacillus bovis]|nr:hypothetical protein [Paenibacillus bovis]
MNSELYRFFEKISWIAHPDTTLTMNERNKMILQMIDIYNPLDHIMGTEDAAVLSGNELSSDRIKRLCQEGELRAIKIGKQWILDKNQEIKAKRKRK